MTILWLRNALYPVEAPLNRVWRALPPVRARVARREAEERDRVMLGRDIERQELGLPNRSYSPWFEGLDTNQRVKGSERVPRSLRFRLHCAHVDAPICRPVRSGRGGQLTRHYVHPEASKPERGSGDWVQN